MCGRFTLRTPAQDLSDLFEQLQFAEFSPRYNIAPTQKVLAVRHSEHATPESVWLRWGLVPFWAKELKIGAKMINARSETVASKPAFRAAFKKRRCLILTDGFYEWKKQQDGKQPFYIHRSDDGPFCFAGLWESWTDKNSETTGAEPVETCTILTTSANDTVSSVHDRMPVILDEEARRLWLDVQFQDKTKLEELLVPCPDDELELYPVSKIVNKPVNDSPECIEREPK